jgi:hypothetical protein
MAHRDDHRPRVPIKPPDERNGGRRHTHRMKALRKEPARVPPKSPRNASGVVACKDGPGLSHRPEFIRSGQPIRSWVPRHSELYAAVCPAGVAMEPLR